MMDTTGRDVAMDWTTGVLRIPGTEDATGPGWRLVVAADWMPRADQAEAMINNPVGFYHDLTPTLAEADLRLVNVECVLGEAGEAIVKSGPCLRAPEDTVGTLTSVPFDVACLANNHTLDFGPEGLAHTIDVLHDAGLATVGAGPDQGSAAQPWTTEVRGVPVAVINCAEGEFSRSVDGGPGAYGFDLTRLHTQITELKAAGKVVVVVFHGGREYVPVPPPYVVQGLRAVAQFGADVVIAHHPHAPQGIELHHGVPIAYSLGNFAFQFFTDNFYAGVGYVACVDFVGSTVTGVEALPYRIAGDGLHLLTGTDRDTFATDLTRANAVLADDAGIRDVWDAVVDRLLPRDRLEGFLTKGTDALVAGDAPRLTPLENQFTTPAHAELTARSLHRIRTGTAGTAPDWARDMVDHWMDLPQGGTEAEGQS